MSHQVSRRTLLRLAAAGLTSAAFPLVGCTGEGDQVRASRHRPSPDSPLTPTPAWYFVALNGAYEADLARWRLHIGGVSRKSRDLSLDQLQRRYEVVRSPITLACVGDTPGGRLHSSSIFEGVRLVDVMEDIGVRSRATGALITSLDGYVMYRSLEEIQRPETLLAFAMGTDDLDMQPLPVDHGFPLRILTPGYYGYVQPKWLSAITFVDDADHISVVSRSVGYAHGRIQLASGFSKPYTDGAYLEAGLHDLHGYAFGDGRTISRVELQIDGGPWRDTELVWNSPDDDLPAGVWAIWYFPWQATEGTHALSLRATYEDGESQIEGRAFPYSGGSRLTWTVEVVPPLEPA